MGTQDRFLMELYRQTEGRSDRTVHAYLHVAKPLHLSEVETEFSVTMLAREGLIARDTMFDRLIWLTLTGIAMCEQRHTADTLVHDTVMDDIYIPLIALRETYASIGGGEVTSRRLTHSHVTVPDRRR
jgi:hypothetical protein